MTPSGRGAKALPALILLSALALASGCGEPPMEEADRPPPGNVTYGIVFKNPAVATGETVTTAADTITVYGIGPFADWSGPFTGGCIQTIPTPAVFTWQNVTTGEVGTATAYATNEWLAGCYFGDAVWGALIPLALGVNRLEFTATGGGGGWDYFYAESTTP